MVCLKQNTIGLTECSVTNYYRSYSDCVMYVNYIFDYYVSGMFNFDFIDNNEKYYLSYRKLIERLEINKHYANFLRNNLISKMSLNFLKVRTRNILMPNKVIHKKIKRKKF